MDGSAADIGDFEAICVLLGCRVGMRPDCMHLMNGQFRIYTNRCKHSCASFRALIRTAWGIGVEQFHSSFADPLPGMFPRRILVLHFPKDPAFRSRPVFVQHVVEHYPSHAGRFADSLTRNP